jgi:hypothetical protein
MPITTPPYQVPCVDVTPDPPIFSLVTTFKGTELVIFVSFFASTQIQLLPRSCKTRLLYKKFDLEEIFQVITLYYHVDSAYAEIISALIQCSQRSFPC